MDIKEYFKKQKETIDSYLEQNIFQEGAGHGKIYEAVRYSLFPGGKRIRPLVSLAVCDLVQGDLGTAMAGGCAVEMIHTYSLIHDDLPCMDDDDFRRGRLSSHKQFGEAIAVLAGDALQAMAFELIGTKIDDAEKAFKVLNELSHAAGPEGMVGGQMLDLLYEGKGAASRTLDDLHELQRRKTGALISASVRIGAYSGSCSGKEMQALSDFGETIGILFQMVDDILDEEGGFEKLGKTVGKDSASDKLTFPALMGIEKAKQYRDTLQERAHKSLEIFDNRGILLGQLCDFITKRDH